MKPIISAKPGDQFATLYGKKIPFHITVSENISEAASIISSTLSIAYKHAVINNRQLLYAMIGNKCWTYEDNELSRIISNIKKNNPALAQRVINNFRL